MKTTFCGRSKGNDYSEITMKMLAALGCMMLLFRHGLSLSSTEPGIKIRLSQTAIDYGAQKAMDVAASSLIGQHIPDESGTFHLPVGKVKYSISSTTIVAFKRPNASVQLVPDREVVMTSSDGSISMHGKWHYNYHALDLDENGIKDSGVFDVTASGIHTNISVLLGMDKTGHSTIRTAGCLSAISGMHITFHHGASWLYRLFHHRIARTMKHQINQKLCVTATDIIDTTIALKLRTMKMQVDIGTELTLDYRFVEDPVVTSSYVDVFLKGEFFDRDDPSEVPFLPHALPNPLGAPKMLTLWVSAYVFNTFAYVTETRGLLQYTVTNNDLKKFGKDGLLNTTCPGSDCIGTLIPELSRCCPNSSLTVGVRSSGDRRPPQFDIHRDDLSGYFSGVLSFLAKSTGGKESSLFDVFVNVSTSLDVYIEDQVVKMKVSSLTSKLDVVHSNIGPVNLLALEGIVTLLLKVVVVPYVNDRGRRGFPLPTFDQLIFVNSTLQFVKGAIQISTDLTYDSDM